MRPPSSVASYLRTQSWERVMRMFFERDNRPIEFSHLRLYLEAAGIKADHPNAWGSLAELLITEKVIEPVGRETAAADSRNGARNPTYRLTEAMWAHVRNQLAPARGWTQTIPSAEAEQTELVR